MGRVVNRAYTSSKGEDMTNRFGTNVKRITLIKAMLVLAMVAVAGFIVSGGGSKLVSAPLRQQTAGLLAPAGSSASAGQSAGIAPAKANAEPQVYPNGVISGQSYKNDVSLPLRDIPPATVKRSAPRREANESPLVGSGHK